MHLKSLVIILFMLCLLTNICTAKTVTVSPTGYSDEDVINQAIQTAYLAGEKDAIVQLNPGIYNIDGKIILTSKITIEGPKEAVIQVSKSSTQWFVKRVGIFSPAGILENVKLSGFTIDGNCENLPIRYANYEGIHDAGRSINLIMETGKFGKHIELCGLTIQDCYSDGIHLVYWEDVKIHDNYIRNTQHEGVFLVDCKDVVVYNNYVEGITSDAVRFDNCVRVKAYNNYITSYFGNNNHGAYEGGINGFQIGDEGVTQGSGSPKPDSTDNIEIYNNVIENVGLAGILLGTTGQSDNERVYIHHNTIKNCGYGAHSKAQYGAGIAVQKWVDGIEINHNTIDNCYQAGILVMNTLGPASAKICDNNIVNTKGKSQTGSGYPVVGWGIFKGTPAMKLEVSGNYFSNNLKGNTNVADRSPADTMLMDAGGNGNSMMVTYGTNSRVHSLDTSNITMPDLTIDTVFESLENLCVQAPTNATVILPDGYDEIPTKGLVTVIYEVIGNNTTTIIKAPKDKFKGVSEIRYEVQGKTATHTLLLGEMTTKGVVFTETTLWTGELDHLGDDVIIPGRIDLSSISIVCVTPKASFTPILDGTTVKVKPAKIHPAMIGIFMLLIVCVYAVLLFMRY